MKGLCEMQMVSFSPTHLDIISCSFLEKYVPRTLRDHKKDDFMTL